MTDYAALVGSKGPVDDKLEAFDFKPEGYVNGGGEPLVLTIHPVRGTRFKKALRIAQIKSRNAKEQDEDNSGVLSEEEIAAVLRENDEATAEMLARCTDGWNLVRDGKPLKFSVQAVKDLYLEVEDLREAVDDAATEAGKKLLRDKKKKKRA